MNLFVYLLVKIYHMINIHIISGVKISKFSIYSNNRPQM